MIVENIRKPHEVEYTPNLANFLMDHESWARKLRIDCSYAKFRVVTEKIWPFQISHVKNVTNPSQEDKQRRGLKYAVE